MPPKANRGDSTDQPILNFASSGEQKAYNAARAALPAPRSQFQQSQPLQNLQARPSPPRPIRNDQTTVQPINHEHFRRERGGGGQTSAATQAPSAVTAHELSDSQVGAMKGNNNSGGAGSGSHTSPTNGGGPSSRQQTVPTTIHESEVTGHSLPGNRRGRIQYPAAYGSVAKDPAQPPPHLTWATPRVPEKVGQIKMPARDPSLERQVPTSARQQQRAQGGQTVNYRPQFSSHEAERRNPVSGGGNRLAKEGRVNNWASHRMDYKPTDRHRAASSGPVATPRQGHGQISFERRHPLPMQVGMGRVDPAEQLKSRHQGAATGGRRDPQKQGRPLQQVSRNIGLRAEQPESKYYAPNEPLRPPARNARKPPSPGTPPSDSDGLPASVSSHSQHSTHHAALQGAYTDLTHLPEQHPEYYKRWKASAGDLDEEMQTQQERITQWRESAPPPSSQVGHGAPPGSPSGGEAEEYNKLEARQPRDPRFGGWVGGAGEEKWKLYVQRKLDKGLPIRYAG